MLASSPRILSDICGITIQEANQLKIKVALYICGRPSSEEQALTFASFSPTSRSSEQSDRFRWGFSIDRLDMCSGGGVPSGSIVELIGGNNSKLLQIASSLCITASKNMHRVVYITCRSTTEIAKSLVATCNTQNVTDKESALRLVSVRTVVDPWSLLKELAHMADMNRYEGPSLIVVDDMNSLLAPFTPSHFSSDTRSTASSSELLESLAAQIVVGCRRLVNSTSVVSVPTETGQPKLRRVERSNNNPLGTSVLILQRCPLFGSLGVASQLPSSSVLMQSIHKACPLWYASADCVDMSIYVTPVEDMGKAMHGAMIGGRLWHENEMGLLETDVMFPNLLDDREESSDLVFQIIKPFFG